MFCTKCGKQISNEAIFCPECGNRVSNSQSTQQPQNTYRPAPTYHQQTPPPAQPTQPSYSYNTNNKADDYINEDIKSRLGTKILVFGILSLVISFIPGWVFGSIARNNAEEYLYLYGSLTGKALAGKIIGTFGLVFSIISTILIGLYFTIICCMFGAAM